MRTFADKGVSRGQRNGSPPNVANAFNNFCITVTEKLNIQQLEKGDAISLLKDSFHGIFPNIKIIPITEAQIKIIIHSRKQTKKKKLGYNEITSKMVKACATLIGHPFSYIYNHSPYMAIFRVCLEIAVLKSTLQERRQNWYDNLQASVIIDGFFLGYSRKLCTVD